MANHKILIVGGGLAGLALGQGLKHARVPFTIFERDSAASFRAQGYRIRIDENGGQALKNLLPPDIFDTFEATCAPVIEGGHRLDAATGKPGTMTSQMPAKPGRKWNADRTVLRNLLLTGLEEHVQFGKRLTRYELVDGGAIAHFDDGTSEPGTILVGADGMRSQTRRQMFPDYVLLDTEGRSVFGKTLIKENTFKKVSKEVADGLTLTSHIEKPNVKLLCDMMRFDKERDLPADYIYWVLVFQKDELNDEALATYNDKQSVDLASRLTMNWHSSIRAIITDSEASASSTLRFTMSRVDLPELADKQTDPRITLIGDSLHPMPPTAGVGANAAFCDAAALLKALLGDVGDLEARMTAFEKTVRARSSTELKMSAQGAVHLLGMKPVDQLRPAVEAW